VQRLEYENGQLKGNTLANWEPMELSENWTDVVAPPCSGHHSCGGVLDSLEPLDQAVGFVVHDRITDAWTTVLAASADNERTTGRN